MTLDGLTVGETDVVDSTTFKTLVDKIVVNSDDVQKEATLKLLLLDHNRLFLLLLPCRLLPIVLTGNTLYSNPLIPSE